MAHGIQIRRIKFLQILCSLCVGKLHLDDNEYMLEVRSDSLW